MCGGRKYLYFLGPVEQKYMNSLSAVVKRDRTSFLFAYLGRHWCQTRDDPQNVLKLSENLQKFKTVSGVRHCYGPTQTQDESVHFIG